MGRRVKVAVGAVAGVLAGLQCLQSKSGKTRPAIEDFVFAPSLGSSPLPLMRDSASAALRPLSPTGISAGSVGFAPYAVACGIAALLSARRRREGRFDACATVCAAKKKAGAEKKVSRKSPKKKGGGGEEDDGQEFDFDADAFVSQWDSKMDGAVNIYLESLITIRAGRAAPELIHGIKVSAFDSELKLSEVANVTASDQTTLTVSCYDPSTVPSVEKALQANNDLGFSVAVREEVIVVTLPQLTTDKRKQYAKLAKDGAEQARISVRNVRQAAMKKLKGLKDKMSEDQSKFAQSSVDDAVKKRIGDIDSALQKKEKELMAV